MSGVWADLIGQWRAVAVLRRAVDGAEHAMTHAWLITGPPGSGRSTAAKAFAAALQCQWHGCGECQDCRTVLAGSHPDVTLVRTEKLSIGVDQIRELARRSAMTPRMRKWQVLVIEDADRITDYGANALLKSIEEPPPRTVWILCAPSSEDVIPTIRSRCRELRLVSPTDAAVAQLLISRDGVNPELAYEVARIAGGHVGKARGLARDLVARQAREALLKLPTQLDSVGACLQAAADIVAKSESEVKAEVAALNTRERAETEALYTAAKGGARSREAQSALKRLDEEQKAREKRLQRDRLDSALTELTTWYRDVLALQLGAVTIPPTAADLASDSDSDTDTEPPAAVAIINLSAYADLTAAAAATTPERTIASLDAILQARRAIESNVAPLLALEAMMLTLGGQ
ncbi:MAG: DNA polymerase III subunit delta' [Propionibacteriaceae bacterium]|nr:DNA polymerase III subunit delta' [Propionibacteriaceae bacterium]